jgi:hypothetical protein
MQSVKMPVAFFIFKTERWWYMAPARIIAKNGQNGSQPTS